MPRSSKQTKSELELTRHWGLLLGLGVIFVIMGLLGFGMSFALTMASMFILGVLFVIGGCAQIIDAFKSKQWKAVVLHAVIGLFYLIGGGLVIYDPILASVVITMLLAWVFIFIGISRLMMCFTLRHGQGWGWILLSGVISIVLGLLILLQWPLSGLWIIGLFIAIELVVAGWTYIFLAFAMRRTS